MKRNRSRVGHLINGKPLGNVRKTPWFLRNSLKFDGVLPALAVEAENNRYSLNREEVASSDIFTFTGEIDTRTYIDSDGIVNVAALNELRLDYSKGYRAIVYSAQDKVQYANYTQNYSVFWSPVNITRSVTTQTAPDGNNNAVKYTRDSTATSYVQNNQIKPTTDAEKVTISEFVHKDTAQYFAMRLQNSYPARVDAVFDLDNGSLHSLEAFSGMTNEEAGIEALPGNTGWYRCWITATTAGTSATITHLYSFNDTGVVLDATDTGGTGSASGFPWGAQTELGDLTSYIPRPGNTAVTRGKESLTIQGTSFSDWHSDTNNTLILDGNLRSSADFPVILEPRSWDVTDRLYSQAFATAITSTARTNGTTDAGNISASVFNEADDFVFAIAYNATDYKNTIDGNDPNERSYGIDLPGFAVLRFDDAGGFSPEEFFIKNFYAYTAYLSDDAMQEATDRYLDFWSEGDSYTAGADVDTPGTPLGLSISLRSAESQTISNFVVGGSTLEEATLRIESNPLAGVDWLVFLDGSVNGHGTVSEDMALYDRIWAATKGKVVFVSSAVYPALGAPDVTHTNDLRTALIAAYPNNTININAFADTIVDGSGVIDASLMQSDNIHPNALLFDPLSDLVVAYKNALNNINEYLLDEDGIFILDEDLYPLGA